VVLRHYGVPCRLLDWTQQPTVAAYFATRPGADSDDGEIWAFDRPFYQEEGKKQWVECPATTVDGSGDPDKFDQSLRTAFALEEPSDTCNWFACQFYGPGFHRQTAQGGAYSITARFDRDHATAIADLLGDDSHYRRYIIDAAVKVEARRILLDEHGIWRGSLFPDSAGAAETVALEVFGAARS
jgi:hypothetical protein